MFILPLFFLSIAFSSNIQDYLSSCRETRIDPIMDKFESFSTPGTYMGRLAVRNALKEIFLQMRPHSGDFGLLQHWESFLWYPKDYVEVIQADAIDALRIMLSFPQANLDTMHELITTSLQCYDANPSVQGEIIKTLIEAGVRASQQEIDLTRKKGLTNQITLDLDSIQNIFKSSVDESCRKTNIYGPYLTLENSLLPAMEANNIFNVKCLLRNDKINTAYYKHIMEMSKTEKGIRFGFGSKSRAAVQQVYVKYRTCPCIDALFLLLEDPASLKCFTSARIFLDLDAPRGFEFMARYLVMTEASSRSMSPALSHKALAAMFDGRPFDGQLLRKIWIELLDENGLISVKKIDSLLHAFETMDTDVGTLSIPIFDLILKTLPNPAKNIAFLVDHRSFKNICADLPPGYVKNVPSFGKRERRQLMTVLMKCVLTPENRSQIINLDPCLVYSELIYFAKRSVVQAMINEDDVEKWMPPKGVEFCKQLISETNTIKPGELFPEERFWVNCLLDNYLFAQEDNDSYAGSIEIEASEINFKRILFPDFNAHYSTHVNEVIGKMIIDGSEEAGKIARFQGYLKNIVESGQRFLNGAITYENITKRLLNLRPGESYALDVYWRKFEQGRQGHLVIGVITKSETKYDVNIINTGFLGRYTDEFAHRMVINDSMVNVPSYVLIDNFIPIMDSDELVMKNYRLNSDQPMQSLGSEAKPTEYYFRETIREQRSGTCSVKRIWAMAKWVLGLDLYMEFKVHFVLSFIEHLSENYDKLVKEEWKSPRPSIWLRIVMLPFLEKGLLRQLERLSSDSERYKRLSAIVIESVERRHDAPGLEYLRDI